MTTTTVLFTDLVNSTPTVVGGGDDGVALITEHLRSSREVIERTGGRVTKTLGDGVMALFDSSYQALLGAIALQQMTVEHARGGDGLQLRVGVHVGEIITDADGDDAFGSAVVIASRLANQAAPGQILATDLVRQLVGTRGALDLSDLGLVDVKGIVEPVRVWSLAWSPAAPKRVRVVVADDAALIREGIVRLLASGGFDVVGEAADHDTLIAAVEATVPDLVVTDIRMPPTNSDEGLRAAATIRAAHPTVAVLVLSQHIEARGASGLFDGHPGGIGYLLKERVSDLSEFLTAARTVADGGSVIDPVVADQFLRRRRHDTALARLTERERDVLQLMAQGKANAAIAAELFLGAKTIETHVRSIFDKLDLGDNNPDDNRRVLAVIRWLDATP
jgi:DNA-binding NarL/FixJ family response regulator/class 3 adenylate cyclase